MAEQVEQCKNFIWESRWSSRCVRDANPEKDGYCNICYAAKKRGKAKTEATIKAYNEKWDRRTAARADRDRKLAAHDQLVAALRAVEWQAQGASCPSCRKPRDYMPHAADCQLAQALAAAEGE